MIRWPMPVLRSGIATLDLIRLAQLMQRAIDCPAPADRSASTAITSLSGVKSRYRRTEHTEPAGVQFSRRCGSAGGRFRLWRRVSRATGGVACVFCTTRSDLSIPRHRGRSARSCPQCLQLKSPDLGGAPRSVAAADPRALKVRWSATSEVLCRSRAVPCSFWSSPAAEAG